MLSHGLLGADVWARLPLFFRDAPKDVLVSQARLEGQLPRWSRGGQSSLPLGARTWDLEPHVCDSGEVSPGP